MEKLHGKAVTEAPYNIKG